MTGGDIAKLSFEDAMHELGTHRPLLEGGRRLCPSVKRGRPPNSGRPLRHLSPL
jgi:hypothetical protein